MPNTSSSDDYLKTAHTTFPSFHFRTGKAPVLPQAIAPNVPTSTWGYPRPGIQSPTPAFATAKHYFVDDSTWDAILGKSIIKCTLISSNDFLIDHGEFDDVVVGSGFCALAYIDAAYKIDPHRKILLLERGGRFKISMQLP